MVFGLSSFIGVFSILMFFVFSVSLILRFVSGAIEFISINIVFGFAFLIMLFLFSVIFFI